MWKSDPVSLGLADEVCVSGAPGLRRLKAKVEHAWLKKPIKLNTDSPRDKYTLTGSIFFSDSAGKQKGVCVSAGRCFTVSL